MVLIQHLSCKCNVFVFFTCLIPRHLQHRFDISTDYSYFCRRIHRITETLDLFIQLFFYFRLCLAEDIFDDGLSGFRIVTDSVPALPAAILSLSDVALAVCSSLWHGISPFRNEQYRNQGNKATRKSNCYQKVIICFASLFSLPIATQFLRCRGVLFGYSGAIFERLKVSFH